MKTLDSAWYAETLRGIYLHQQGDILYVIFRLLRYISESVVTTFCIIPVCLSSDQYHAPWLLMSNVFFISIIWDKNIAAGTTC